MPSINDSVGHVLNRRGWCRRLAATHLSGGPEPFLSDWQADCRNAKDKADILDELEKGVGFDKCNTLVVGLLREALVAQGRAALGRLPAAERRGHVLLSSMGMLLKDMGQLEEARPLLEEALQARRETLGDNHPHTLLSISNMSQLEEATRSLPDHTRRRGGMCYAAVDTMGVLLTHISSWGRRPREEELQV